MNEPRSMNNNPSKQKANDYSLGKGDPKNLVIRKPRLALNTVDLPLMPPRESHFHDMNQPHSEREIAKVNTNTWLIDHPCGLQSAKPDCWAPLTTRRR